jgi:ribosomal protein S9
MHDHKHATAATVTVSSAVSAVEVERFVARTAREYDVSVKPAPGGRGTELHATTHALSKADLKQALAEERALLEAGEIPTGARR